jgi:hypothetical protein
VVRPCEHARGDNPIDVLDVIGIVVALGKRVQTVTVVRIILVVIAGRASAAGTQDDKLPGLDIVDVVPCRLRDVPLPGRDVEAEHALNLSTNGQRAAQEEYQPEPNDPLRTPAWQGEGRPLTQ